MKRVAFSLIALFAVSGCLHAANAQNVDHETIDQLGSALTKLTAAVDVYVAEQRGRISGDNDDVIHSDLIISDYWWRGAIQRCWFVRRIVLVV
jgi:hypothetical protein